MTRGGAASPSSVVTLPAFSPVNIACEHEARREGEERQGERERESARARARERERDHIYMYKYKFSIAYRID